MTNHNTYCAQAQEIATLVLNGVKSYARIQDIIRDQDMEALFYKTLHVFCQEKAPALLQKAGISQPSQAPAFLCKCFGNLFLGRYRKCLQAAEKLARDRGYGAEREFPLLERVPAQSLANSADLEEWVRESLETLPPKAKLLAASLMAGEEGDSCSSSGKKAGLSRRMVEKAKGQIIRALSEHPAAGRMLRNLRRRAGKAKR